MPLTIEDLPNSSMPVVAGLFALLLPRNAIDAEQVSDFTAIMFLNFIALKYAKTAHYSLMLMTASFPIIALSSDLIVESITRFIRFVAMLKIANDVMSDEQRRVPVVEQPFYKRLLSPTTIMSFLIGTSFLYLQRNPEEIQRGISALIIGLTHIVTDVPHLQFLSLFLAAVGMEKHHVVMSTVARVVQVAPLIKVATSFFQNRVAEPLLQGAVFQNTPNFN